jgi:DNA processing protein
MISTLDCLVYITHVASQLVLKWIAPPLYTKEDCFLDLQNIAKLADLPRDYWSQLIYEEACLDYSALTGVFQSLAKKQIPLANLIDASFSHLQETSRAGGNVLLYTDPYYPSQLRQIDRFPLALTALGDTGHLRRHMVSVIGSRKATYHALSETQIVSDFLARRGYCVVSGGAFGCDIAAHFGTLGSEVKPCPAAIVFAGGLHETYPLQNKDIFSRVLQDGGLFISERLWFDAAHPYSFPYRNRIVSGLADILLVMQAATRSGTMRTVAAALQQGREIFVLRHPAGDARSDGSELLIEEGARSFCSAEDFVQQLASDPRNLLSWNSEITESNLAS